MPASRRTRYQSLRSGLRGRDGVERRRKDERAAVPRLAFEDAPGLAVEGNPSRPCLAVREDQILVMDLRPAQLHDLAPAASGEQQETDDVGLLAPALSGLAVQDPMEAADLLPGQEARESRPPVLYHPPRRVGVDVAACGRERHDLPEKCESVVGIAGGGAAEGIEPSLHLGRGNAVERLRSEGGQEPSVEKPGHASPGRWLVSVEMSLFPRVLDEIPEQRGGVRRPGGPVRLGTRLVLKALSPAVGGFQGRQQPAFVQPLMAGLESVVVPDHLYQHRIEGVAVSASVPALVENRCDLAIGVVVQQPVDLGNDLVTGLMDLTREWTRFPGELSGRAAAQPHPQAPRGLGHPHKRILGSNAGPGSPYAAQRPVISRVLHPLHPHHRLDLH